MNKSFATNALSALLVGTGYYLDHSVVFTVGLFALSGAVTNWLAVHMLFEKVPGLYGSGVIPARFEDFKLGIRELMMEQFFTEENIDRFLSEKSGEAIHYDLTPVLEKVDLSPAYDSLVSTVTESSFGSMLAMVGGAKALEPLKEPFVRKMKTSLIAVTESDNFRQLLREQIERPDAMTGIRDKVEDIIEQRLNELTPRMVKEIIQTMIKKHLGWLVVWGGVFGGLIGFLATSAGF